MTTHAEQILALRKRLNEAVEAGAVDKSAAEVVQQTLLQIVNEAERARQSCEASVARLHEQIAMSKGKAEGFTQVSSIAMAVLGAMISNAERSAAEEVRLREERAEREKLLAQRSPETALAEAEAVEAPPAKKQRKR